MRELSGYDYDDCQVVLLKDELDELYKKIIVNQVRFTCKMSLKVQDLFLSKSSSLFHYQHLEYIAKTMRDKTTQLIPWFLFI
jgi:hypothetical protein